MMGQLVEAVPHRRKEIRAQVVTKRSKMLLRLVWLLHVVGSKRFAGLEARVASDPPSSAGDVSMAEDGILTSVVSEIDKNGRKGLQRRRSRSSTNTSP